MNYCKVNYNGEFKTIDTPEKAYVLGLFYSDGSILTPNEKKKSYRADITMHKNDKYLLEEIQKAFPFFTIRKMINNAYTLVCYRKAIVEDLLNNGVYFKKSTDNKELLQVPKLKQDLYSHFIRGFFDGDGSVYKQKLGNTKIEIGGTCFNLITGLIKILYDNRITVNLRCKYIGEALRKHDFYILYTSSDKISKQFAEYIYKDCGKLFLKRKYDKLFFIPEYSKKERLVCPICGGNNTVYNTIRIMKHGAMQRGECKDCKKRFSLPVTAPLCSNTQSGGDELLED